MHHNLTSREIDLLDSLREGLGNKDIAIRLGITEATVRVHMRVLFAKVGAKNRTQAALWWDRIQGQRGDAMSGIAAVAAEKLKLAISAASDVLTKLEAAR